jgi:hypothetical protein
MSNALHQPLVANTYLDVVIASNGRPFRPASGPGMGPGALRSAMAGRYTDTGEEARVDAVAIDIDATLAMRDTRNARHTPRPSDPEPA